MRPNLITRLKEEWNNLDPVDPLRGLIADAIDALAEAQPSKPLTDKQISKLWSDAHNDTTDRMAFQVLARLVEAAHGIKGDA